jgi:hypothetical protein
MIKIFPLLDFYLRHTPFSSTKPSNLFQKNDVFLAYDEEDCDILVAGRLNRNLLARILKYRSKKGYLVWTLEPRYDIHFQSRLKGFLGFPDIHFMTVYTGDIYLDNYSIPRYAIDRLLEPLDETNFSDFKHKKIVTLLSYKTHSRKKWSLKKDGKELDLIYLRQEIALEGFYSGKVDIYGRRWSKDIALGESRQNNWHGKKLEILNNYHFNLCFENTNFDYYWTEKIWDSIRGGCLPIYYGNNNKIYEDFPRKSFLDYCDFGSSKELFAYIDSMTVSEFRERMNLCIEVYNRIYQKLQNSAPRRAMLQNIIDKLQKIFDEIHLS